jgi:chromosomal replication initiation ATPase DnaA
MENTVTPPAIQWAHETIQAIKDAITDREGHVNRETVTELSGIYADILLVEINKLRANVKRELYGDGIQGSVVDLMNAIAEMYNIAVDEFELKTRKRQYLEPRQLLHWAMWNKVVKNNLTLEQIGQITGGSDHATVIHSNRQVKNRISTEREFRETVMKFCNDFGLKTKWTGNNIEIIRVL